MGWSFNPGLNKQGATFIWNMTVYGKDRTILIFLFILCSKKYLGPFVAQPAKMSLNPLTFIAPESARFRTAHSPYSARIRPLGRGRLRCHIATGSLVFMLNLAMLLESTRVTVYFGTFVVSLPQNIFLL